MSNIAPHVLGWQRDLPDHRDLTASHEDVTRLLGELKTRRGQAKWRPERVDLREFCPPVNDQEQLPTSTVHACVALLQYFERRANGHFILPSRLFIYYTARRLSGAVDLGVSLRAALKAIVRFGLPPERFWPYEADRMDEEPDSFAYAFDRESHALRYLRLDEQNQSGQQALDQVRAFLAAGFPCTVGFPLYSSVTREPYIPFPTLYDTTHGGHAVAIVGYDDKIRIRSDKGALLVRNSWGADWGENGYGWLPYSFVREKLAVDLWTMLRPDWLQSNEFHRPQ